MAKIEENNQETERRSTSKLKEGSIPFVLDPNRSPNNASWSSPPCNTFMVRGPQYAKTKAKIPCTDYLLKPLAFDWIKGPRKISNLLQNPKHRVRRAIELDGRGGQNPFLWAFNFQLPTKEHHSIVAYFSAHQPFSDHSLTGRFLKGDDGFRNSRLKLIVNVVKGPWIVTKAVGKQAICLIGRALTCTYSKGEGFLEVDIDVASSIVASAVFHLSFGYFKNLTVDVAFLIEGRDESELPEQVLGAVRFSGLDGGLAERVEGINGSTDHADLVSSGTQ